MIKKNHFVWSEVSKALLNASSPYVFSLENIQKTACSVGYAMEQAVSYFQRLFLIHHLKNIKF